MLSNIWLYTDWYINVGKVLRQYVQLLLVATQILLLIYSHLHALHCFSFCVTSPVTCRLLIRFIISVDALSPPPLHVKLLGQRESPGGRRGSSPRTHGAPSRRGPRTDRQDSEPAAFNIQTGDGCLRQINVFYNSPPASRRNLELEGRKKNKRTQLSIIVHTNEQEPWKTNAIG